MTLQGMADHRLTSVSLFTNVFLGEIILLRTAMTIHTSLERTGSWLPFQKDYTNLDYKVITNMFINS